MRIFYAFFFALMISSRSSEDPEATSFKYPEVKEVTQGEMFGNIMIVWELVEGADEYRIYSNHPDFVNQWDEISKISYHMDYDNGCNLKDGKIAPGITYKYRLSSVSDKHEESELSPIFEVFSANTPDKPVITNITLGLDCIQLTWQDDNPKLKNEYWPRDYNAYSRAQQTGRIRNDRHYRG